MLGSVDLHQLTQIVAPRARLMKPFTLPALRQQAFGDHPLPQRLDTDLEAVLHKLLGRKGRSEIVLALG